MHQGHRERMRKRIEENGINSLADHEILEYLLYFIHKRGNTNDIAHELMNHFHSLDKIFDADAKALIEVNGVGETTAQFLSILPEFLHRYDRSRKEESLRFVSLSRVVEWLTSAYYGASGERTMLLCMDADFNLIHEEAWKEGSASETMVSIREIVATCLKFDAAKVIFSHNHVTNIKKPSMEDVMLTNELRGALKNVQIELMDHVILCPNGDYYSFKNEGRL